MKKSFIPVIGLAAGLLLTVSCLSACPGSGSDSVELGCVEDSDCFKEGEAARYCQKETGICLNFTSPPGSTEPKDSSVEDGFTKDGQTGRPDGS